MNLSLPNIDRRTLLIGGGAGVGLVVAFLVWPKGSSSPLGRRAGEQVFGAFVKIGRDGRVTVAVPQVETGQGIWTSLPQVLAHELGAAWETVGAEPAPLVSGYANALSGAWMDALGLGSEPIRITAASTSMRAFEEPFHEAGSTARAMLIAAAAHRWDVDAADCDTADGLVLHQGKALRFGEIAEEAASLRPASIPRRRPRGDSALAGKPLPRLDGPSKSNGSFRFAADVRVPGMMFAAARLAPPDGRVADFSRDQARSIPGVEAVVDTPQWVSVIAQTSWAAEQALSKAQVRFEARGHAGDWQAKLDQLLAADEGETLFSRGDYASAIEGSRPLGATYRVAPALHLGLEPLTATARFSDGRLEIWAPTQAPEQTRAAAAEAAGLGAGDVTLYPMPVGDSGGRALEADAVPLAVRLAKQLDRPVQLTLSQSSSQIHDRPAPAAVARMYALPANGSLGAWRMRLATADGLGVTLSRMNGEGEEALPMFAGAEPPYAIPNVRIEATSVEMPFVAGYLRGDPYRTLAFCTESFVDEMARIAGADPLAFRIAMLGNNARLARCLSAAAAAGGWDGGASGSTMGLAACSAFGSHIGLLADATIGADQRVQVHRLVATVDCGRIANPHIVRQQIAGGLIWALGTATARQPDWRANVPLARSLRSWGLPRIGDTPEVRVDLVASNQDPGGVSGLGPAVLAPAVANAIFAGTGRRLRNLPFDPMAEQ